MKKLLALALITFFCCSDAVFDCSKYSRNMYPYWFCEFHFADEDIFFRYTDNNRLKISYIPENDIFGYMSIDCSYAKTIQECSERQPNIYLNADLTITGFHIKHRTLDFDDISYSELISKFNTSHIQVPHKERVEEMRIEKGLILNGDQGFYSMASISNNFVSWFRSNKTTPDIITEIFARQNSIQYLEMYKLQSIPVDAFSEVRNLTKLTYWKINNLYLNSSHFDKMKNVDSLKIVKNKIKNCLPNDLFRSLKKLKNLIWTNNSHVILPNKLLADLPLLENVDLRHSALDDLPSDIFHNSPKLLSIKLNNNGLESIPETLFRDAVNLVRLDLSFNKIQSLPEVAFRNLTSIEEINLTNNLFEAFNRNSFMDNQKLKILKISQNRITSLLDLYFPRSLEVVDFSLNKINFEGEDFSPFNDLKSLVSLDLSHNNITTYDMYWSESPVLRTFKLSFNNIPEIELYDFHLDFKVASREIVIDLRHNKIAAFSGYEYYQQMKLETTTAERRLVLIGSNPFVCDCKMKGLVNYLKTSRGEAPRTIVTPAADDAFCAEPKTLVGVRLAELIETSLNCDLRNKN